MRRIALLLLCVVTLMAQKADGPLHVKAFVCAPANRDLCGKRSRSGFEPARIRLEVYISPHPENRQVIYGLRCTGDDEPRAVSGPYDLDPRQAFLFVEHPDVGSGQCYGVAQLARVAHTDTGDTITRLNAESAPILILGRD
jgi:hypothetical protein